MRKRCVLLGVAILLLAGGSWVVSTQTLPHRPMVAHKVKGDLYMIEGQGGNVAVYVTGEGVILVDDMYDENHGEIMATVKSLTAQPIKYVLNTHQHGDHAGGNAKMLAVADVIAHRNVRTNMAKRSVPGMPRVTFSDEMSVHLGGKEVRARHHGRGHTDGDVFIYFPEVGAHTGDMFLTNTSTLQPYIDYANGGTALAWPATLDSVLKMDFDAVIPGHGPLSNRAGIVRWQSTFKTMLDRVRAMARQGRSKDEIAQMLVKDYEFQPAAINQLDALLAELE